MAKFEESDPRWIVQQRADGTNVNNWHWTEKDCLDWARQRLKQLFTELTVVETPHAVVKLTGVDAVDGECFLNIRKNKLVASYELDIKLSWQGQTLDQQGTVVGKGSGKASIPYLAEENHEEDPEIKITCDSDDSTQSLKDAFFSKGRQVVYDVVNKFIAELKAGAPQTAASGAAVGDATAGSDTSMKQKMSSADVPKPKPTAPAKKSRESLTLKETFYARPADLYEVFTNENRIKGFSQSPAQVTPEVGGKFSWFGGAVTGEFTELVPHSKIVMRWKFNTWDDDCYSTVTLEFDQPETGSTVCHLRQDAIPEADKFGSEDVLEVTERGWRDNVFRKIRVVFGYGV